MGFLALYDTVGIQSFMYDSNRLRDNRGGSLLVEECFLKYLVRAVSKTAKSVVLDWKESETPAFLLNKDTECEVIYIGGGNAQLYFQNIELYKKVNTEFSKMLLEEIPGITVISEIVEISETSNYGEVINHLFKKLQMKKQKSRGMDSAPLISVTRECAFTRKPAVALGDDGRWISDEIAKKRARAFQESVNESYKETDQLAGKEGEQWIATVHIDGNSMGNHINQLLKDTDLQQGIARIRKFSKEIQKIYELSYEEMLEECRKLINNSTDSRLEGYKKEPPFRKIYGAGDDLTFICYAPLAIKAAEIFLRKIAANKSEAIELSACAGIAYTKPGYPFFKAYMMAEQCCKTAKVKARKVQGSYIDFQIVRGSQTSLANLRKQEYVKTEYDLLLRPYAVLTEAQQTNYIMKKDDLEFFYQISRFIANIDRKKIARSKMKALRNAYQMGEKEAKEAIALIKRRYENQLMELEKLIEERNFNKRVPYISSEGKVVLWDALEMMDIYIDL